jgi:hypothetical protein
MAGDAVGRHIGDPSRGTPTQGISAVLQTPGSKQALPTRGGGALLVERVTLGLGSVKYLSCTAHGRVRGMRSSPVSDDVDVAPRLLRIVASRCRLSGYPELAKGLLEDARVLEGQPMREEDRNGAHARLLAREVELATRRRALLSLDDERHRMHLIGLGLYPDPVTNVRIVARIREAGLSETWTAADQPLIQRIIDEEVAVTGQL